MFTTQSMKDPVSILCRLESQDFSQKKAMCIEKKFVTVAKIELHQYMFTSLYVCFFAIPVPCISAIGKGDIFGYEM